MNALHAKNLLNGMLQFVNIARANYLQHHKIKMNQLQIKLVNAMKTVIVAIIALLIFVCFSHAEEWKGKKILLEERDKVIAACEEGTTSMGFAYAKVHNYCRCFTDYMTDLGTKYTKEEIEKIAEEKGGDFMERESFKNCKHHLQ